MANAHHIPVLIALFALLGACGEEKAAPAASTPALQEAAPESAAAVKTRPVIVMLGDSLTAGYDLPLDAALPAQLEDVLAARKINATIINAGVSGDTTEAALNRYQWSVAATKPDILFIALGANDFLNGYPPQTPKDNLEAIIKRAQDDGVTVGLIGISARGGGVRDDYEKTYGKIYAEVANDMKVALFPDMLAPVANKPALLLPDGLHPNAAGVKQVANGLAPFVEKFVAEWRAQHSGE